MQAAAKNRGRLDIVADVLGACFRAATKSVITLRANLNGVTATYLILRLIDSGLIDTVVGDEGRVEYVTTRQGTAFLERYMALIGMLSPGLAPAGKIAERGYVPDIPT